MSQRVSNGPSCPSGKLEAIYLNERWQVRRERSNTADGRGIWGEERGAGPQKGWLSGHCGIDLPSQALPRTQPGQEHVCLVLRP